MSREELGCKHGKEFGVGYPAMRIMMIFCVAFLWQVSKRVDFIRMV